MRVQLLGIVVSVMIVWGLVGCKKQPQTPVGPEKEAGAKGVSSVEQEQRKEADMGLQIQWLGHASFRIQHGQTVVYIDPWKLKEAKKDATIVLVSHSHYDHYSAADIEKVSTEQSKLLGSADVVAKERRGEAMLPGTTVTLDEVRVTGVPAYNVAKQFHPRKNNWLGFVIELGGKRIYYAGDTDLTEEMKMLKDMDVALLPVGGTYTMDAQQAAEAVQYIRPKVAIPYHWGDIVGSEADAKKFAELAAQTCKVEVLQPGQSLSLSQ